MGIARAQDSTQSAGHHYELFDSLRAIAAITVVGAHTWASTGIWVNDATFRMNVGVVIFFVISGFLLYRPFVAARYSGRSMIDVRAYALRRFVRIVPAYWAALTLLAIWPGVDGVFTGDFWVFYGYLQTYGLSDYEGLFPAWSLCIEVAFYFMLPVFALAVSRAARSPQDLRPDVIGLLVLLAISLAMRVGFVADDFGHPVLWGSLPGLLVWFVPGMALAVASVRLREREQEFAVTRFVAGHPNLPWVAALAGYALLCTEIGTAPFVSYGGALAESLAYGGIAALVVLPAVFGEHGGGLVRRLLGSRWLLWLGSISYGIYLWHYPLVFEVADITTNPVLAMIGALAVTIPCAALSWYLLERPAIAWGRRRTARRRANTSGDGQAAEARAVA